MTSSTSESAKAEKKERISVWVILFWLVIGGFIALKVLDLWFQYFLTTGERLYEAGDTKTSIKAFESVPNASLPMWLNRAKVLPVVVRVASEASKKNDFGNAEKYLFLALSLADRLNISDSESFKRDHVKESIADALDKQGRHRAAELIYKKLLQKTALRKPDLLNDISAFYPLTQKLISSLISQGGHEQEIVKLYISALDRNLLVSQYLNLYQQAIEFCSNKSMADEEEKFYSRLMEQAPNLVKDAEASEIKELASIEKRAADFYQNAGNVAMSNIFLKQSKTLEASIPAFEKADQKDEEDYQKQQQEEYENSAQYLEH